MRHFRYLSTLRARLVDRSDSEHTQAIARLVFVGVGLGVILVWDRLGAVHETSELLAGLGLVGVSFLVSLALLAAVVARPAPSVTRRYLGIVHDIAFLSGVLYLVEGIAAPFAALYLLTALGNGIRFGTTYLYVATALALVGFGTVFATSEYWREAQLMLSFNIFMLLGLIPLYLGRLLSSVHDMQSQLAVRANLDALTGLLNRAEFERAVGRTLRAHRGGHALLFCDLDKFKRVNDEAGHAAGDKLLYDVGQLILSAVRSEDLCARVGGDEFCVFLLNCTNETAQRIGEAIRDKVDHYRLHWHSNTYAVGVSIGVVPTNAESRLVGLLRLADAACYAAKNAGRNRVYVVDPNEVDLDTARVRQLFRQVGEDTQRSRTAGHGNR